MNIEQNANGILIYQAKNGYLVKQFYVGYTLAEAKRNFKIFFKGK